MVQVGGVLGALVAEGVLPLADVGTATIEAAVQHQNCSAGFGAAIACLGIPSVNSHTRWADNHRL